MPSILRPTDSLGIFHNSRANLFTHYDLGNTLFAAFLNPCNKPEHPESLETAQLRKIIILAEARTKTGNHILENGTVWGLGSLVILSATIVAVRRAMLLGKDIYAFNQRLNTVFSGLLHP
ncbi:hypothetical protein B0H11DRAFT_2028155 [Mycena galericulata]|nr:hypothetical protein B0H11DRAFT_2028155 [Mycena galericulata]